ncbi:MAG: hypothetical protein WBV82_03095 [Myxococcaceae bacterium]
MRNASVVVVLAVAFATTVHAAPDKAAAESLQQLDRARANVAAAVQRIEKDPPSTKDLDAAHVAVEALKEAIDAAAEHEAKSLEHAKAVLAARKDLRVRREYVDDRRAKIQLHDARRRLDAELSAMDDRVSRLEAREPGQKGFDEARAAIGAVKKSADEARSLTRLDANFATWLAEVDTRVARQQNAVDDRWLQLSAEKQRGALEESRRALSAAMAALGKSWTDAQFQSADKASEALARRLQEGAPLEAKDKAYRTEAEKARGELTHAKKRMAELVKEAGLSRVKAEIEPAHSELATAAKGLKARKSSEEHLAHAKTASLVVRMLVEKYEPQAARSPELGQYLGEVKRTLFEVETTLKRRAIELAMGDVRQGLRALEKRAPTDEQFEEATSAVVVLEKTLEGAHRKDAELNAQVADARQLIRDARASIQKRRQEVELQRQRAKIDEARRNATAAVAELQQDRPSNEQFKEAEQAVNQVGVVLQEGAALTRKDRDFAQYARETRERIAELNERIAKRRLALAARDGRKELQESVAAAKQKLETARTPEATDADVKAASEAVEAVGQVLERRGELEKKDAGYAAQADRTRIELGRLLETLDGAMQARELRRETGEALAAGLAGAKEAESARDLRTKKGSWETAAARFKSCEENGARMLEQAPALARTVVLVNGEPLKATEVTTLCAAQGKSTAAALNEVIALIRVDEGTLKAFETGKQLLGKSRKQEALAQFDVCIAEGLIAANRWPELKERKFAAAGGNMTVAEMVRECTRLRKEAGK